MPSGRNWPCGRRARSELRKLDRQRSVQCEQRTRKTGSAARLRSVAPAAAISARRWSAPAWRSPIRTGPVLTEPRNPTRAAARPEYGRARFENPRAWRDEHPRDDRPPVGRYAGDIIPRASAGLAAGAFAVGPAIGGAMVAVVMGRKAESPIGLAFKSLKLLKNAFHDRLGRTGREPFSVPDRPMRYRASHGPHRNPGRKSSCPGRPLLAALTALTLVTTLAATSGQAQAKSWGTGLGVGIAAGALDRRGCCLAWLRPRLLRRPGLCRGTQISRMPPRRPL